MFDFNNIKLIIFDLDGTLIDSTSLWSDIDKIFFSRRNHEIPPNYSKEIAHIGLTAAAKYTKEKYFPDEEIDDILKEWNDLALDAYEHHIPLKNNALELLKLLKNKGIIITVATANSEELYLPCLKRLGVDKYFADVVDVNSCKEGKNSSEIYDKITSSFKVSKDEVLIFEDTITALKTAFLAGYNVVGVYDKSSTKSETESKKYCSIFIHDFQEVIDLFS